MSDISKGVLIYNEWFEAMRALDPDDFKAVMLAIYDSQIHNTPPPEFEGVARAIAAIILPYIERRKQQAQRGRAGAVARYSKEGDPPADDTCSIGTASSAAISQNEIKSNKTKSTYTQIKSNEFAYPTATGGKAATGGRDSNGGYAAYKKAPDEIRSFDTNDFFEAAVKRSLGETQGLLP